MAAYGSLNINSSLILLDLGVIYQIINQISPACIGTAVLSFIR